MRTLLLISVLIFPLSAIAQQGLILNEIADTIYLSKSDKFAVRVTEQFNGITQYYIYDDPDKKIRKVSDNKVFKLYKSNERERAAYKLDPSSLKGKKVIMQVTPFSKSLSKFWFLSFDTGLETGSYILTDDNDKPVRFFSEMAAVNYFIGQGWDLHKIMNIEKGSISGGTAFIGNSGIGGNIKISSNLYYFTKTY